MAAILHPNQQLHQLPSLIVHLAHPRGDNAIVTVASRDLNQLRLDSGGRNETHHHGPHRRL